MIPVGITRDGATVLERDDPEAFRLDPERMPEVVDNGSRVRWPEKVGDRLLTVVEADGTERTLGPVDVVFPILHGPFGEDGTVQGLLELTGLPFVGSGVLGSAVGMDKHFTKTLLRDAGLAVAPWRTVTRRSLARDPQQAARALEELGLPVFVKPARAGSSVGVSRVASADQLDAALETAFAEDSRVLIEAGLTGRELEIAVLDGRDGAAPRTSVAGEVVVSGRDFYDFEAKYLGADGITLSCPAEVSESELREFSSLAVTAFEALDLSGLARVDVFLTADGFVVNEVNTMPGFTPISMFPSCWLASGLSYPELITELVELALEGGSR
ncbi:D-alanine--D-alanine ligase [Mycetocola reblochoni REB411]|uniref:D-alanine--D-alanine ligase n=1 Tax=Mycetocola reblochoni REB411 TaxID=1255698 RepID=A0A1R4JAS4_9MICO|nr:D-alanine--D-alanine ligase [Mycetocola reblochoni REB411]